MGGARFIAGYSVMIWVLCFALPAVAETLSLIDTYNGMPVVRVDITIEGGEYGRADWEAIARGLIGIKKGDLYTPEILVEAAGSLDASSIFRQIHVGDPVPEGDGVRIFFRLSLFDRVERIRIDGAFPVYEKEIRSQMTLTSGSPFLPSLLDEQKKRITSFLEKEGYVDPEVVVNAVRDKTSRAFTIDVRIKKPRYFKISTLEFKGNRAVSSTVLGMKVKTGRWRSLPFIGKRFVSRTLKKDEKALLTLYRQKGFADAKIKAVAEKKLETDEVAITFEIDEGPLYRFKYSGNKNFSENELNKALLRSGKQRSAQFRIQTTLRELKNFYIGKGCSDVVISHTTDLNETEGSPVKDILFTIEEGDRYLVSSVDISGNQSLAKKEILDLVFSADTGFLAEKGFSKKKLNDDINAVKSLYLKEGFSKTEVTAETEVSDPAIIEEKSIRQVRIYLSIMEGPRTMVHKVSFSGAGGVQTEKLLEQIGMKSGSPFREYMIKSEENRLSAYFSEAGYPHVRIQGRVDISDEETRADLSYHIEPGPLVKVGQVFFTGNFRTRRPVLMDEVSMTAGEPFSLKQLLETRRDLMNLNALDTVGVKTPGLKEKRHEVDIVFEVEERRPYQVELGTGYDTKRKLYAEFAAADHNFLGQNLRLESRSEVSQIGYGSELSLLNPRLFTTRLSSSTRLFVEELEEFNKMFGTRVYGISQEVFRTVMENRLTVKLAGAYKSQEQYQTEAGDISSDQADAYDSRRIFTLTPSVVFRTTDSYIGPRKGTFSTAQVDISQGIDNSLDDFIKYRLDTRWFYPVTKSFTLAVRGRYGFLQPYGGNSAVPEDQLFFLGGTSTVRGFDENTLRTDAFGNGAGGKEMIMGSIEGRYDLGRNWEFTAFFDTGSIEKASDEANRGGFRSSAGIGIRYMTPIGPVGLLYGRKLDPRDGESSGCFHFSMGYTF